MHAGGESEHVGEIAMLRDVPRTATVSAKIPMKLLTLDRERFLEAETRHPQSHERVWVSGIPVRTTRGERCHGFPPA